MSEARDAILRRLRANPQPALHQSDDTTVPPAPVWDQEEKIRRLTQQLEAVHGEVIDLRERDWMDWIIEECPKRGWQRLLVGANEEGEKLQTRAGDTLQIRRYQNAIEDWKAELFSDIEVGITSTRGGIAATGSLILWPDAAEPRLMSLAPPVHIALLDADSIYSTFAEAIAQQHWTDGMPSNALLISGPSKTADIEQTLSYGIHGPQQLIVLIRRCTNSV